MATPIALFDASILYPAPLRDFLMYLALTDLVQVRWSQRIHEEWINALLRNRSDLNRTQLERTRDLMNSHVLDALVEDYEHHIDGLTLPDPDDRHVLAAAIQSNANLIITFNLRHFPKSVLSTFNIEPIAPDPFVLRLFDSSPLEVIEAAAEHRASLTNPPKNVDDYLDTLTQQRLTKTADRCAILRHFSNLLTP